jgi:anti-sigma B factor antagonist
MATVDEVAGACARASVGGVLVLDLRGIEFMDTSGLRLVLEHQRRADATGLRFVLVRGPAVVQRLFEVAGLGHQLTFVDNPAEALRDGSSDP